MKYVSTFVLCSGPPWVSTSICPNDWNAKMVPTTTAKKIVGDSIGSVTCQNRDHAPAPSTRAASWRSSGTPWSPADIRMNVRPSVCHTVVTDTATRAHEGFWRMGGLELMPSHGSSPTCGSSNVPKITDATATDVATVDEKIVR